MVLGMTGGQESDSPGSLLPIQDMVAEGSPVFYPVRKAVGLIKRTRITEHGKVVDRIPVYEDEIPEDQLNHKIPGEWARMTNVRDEDGAPIGDRSTDG